MNAPGQFSLSIILIDSHDKQYVERERERGGKVKKKMNSFSPRFNSSRRGRQRKRKKREKATSTPKAV
jgi:hypothetical protein